MKWIDEMRYGGPTGEGPAGWKVDVVVPTELQRMQEAFIGRSSSEGPFHVLRHNGQLWMSDTDAEARDHAGAVYRIRQDATDTVLIHGLGLGLVVSAALRYGRTVDVVELDADLVGWMTPWLTDLAAENQADLSIHVDDVMTRQWPVGSYWDVVWHDIWSDINDDNLDGMKRLHRSFGKRSGWQGSWARNYLT